MYTNELTPPEKNIFTTKNMSDQGFMEHLQLHHHEMVTTFHKGSTFPIYRELTAINF